MGTKTLGGGLSFPSNTGTVNEVPMVGSSTDMEGSGIRYVEVNLTAAEVAALATTAKEIVPAPGTGKVAFPLVGTLHLNYTAPAYTESSDNLALYYTDESGARISELIEMTNFITLTADAMTSIIAAKDAIVTAAGSTNQAIVLANPDDNFGNSGGSALQVKLYYFVVDTDL
jgi:hypothetical protein